MKTLKTVYRTLIIGLFVTIAIPASAQSLKLVTENYPPFNMSKSGKASEKKRSEIIGIATDTVDAMFKKAGIDYTLALGNWKRHYDMALKKPGYGVFSTTRTDERDPLFKWVGPLVENNWVLFSMKGKEIKITSLEDAKKYKIGAYTGDAFTNFLIEQGFKLHLTRNDAMNAKKLQGGRIDLWASGHLLGPYNAKKENVSGLKSVFVVKETVMSLALNKAVSDDVVEKLNNALKALKTDGTIKAIETNYR
ncbi:substrate-binding periplasmic protein [Cognaticolwellia mytili]|uniref:substrate-binding periplasmic protein n=1 Tax=Cognaticolwellia mytili TaxID=1888913 RepID=UPI000A175969|nr:ABC transporter substrate-binding protein [Cognaticolwellia mytili]